MLMLLESRVFSVYSLPFSSNACLELREQELVVEAVDRGDVGEDPCNDVLRDSSLCELSAKYLQGLKKKKHNICIQKLIQLYPKHHQIWLLFMEQECKQKCCCLSTQTYSFSPALAS